MDKHGLHLNNDQLVLVADYIKQRYGKQSWAFLIDENNAPKPLGSRLGGIPYWDFAKDYPLDNNGQPLRFLGQINLADLCSKANKCHLPSNGLLQFFFRVDDDLMGCDFERNQEFLTSESEVKPSLDHRVVYHEGATLDSNVSWAELEQQFENKGLSKEQVSNIGQDDDWVVLGECALRLKGFVDMPHFSDQEFFTEVLKESLQTVLNIDRSAETSWLEVLDSESNHRLYNLLEVRMGLTEAERDEHCGQLLGYPDFTQGNPFEMATDKRKEHYNTLLCIFDYGEATDVPQGSQGMSSVEMVWGDCGIADLFINDKQLANKDFSDIFYTWDCA